MVVDGEASVFVSVPNGKVKKMRLVVSQDVASDMLLSLGDQKLLGILPMSYPAIVSEDVNVARGVVKTDLEDAPFPASWPESVRDVLEEFDEVFADALSPGRRINIPPGMEITLKPGANPFQVNGCHQLPHHHIDFAKRDIEAKLKAGTITHVEGPTEWLAGAFWVPKPGQPGQLRMVTDFKNLNRQIVKETVRFPTGCEIFQKIKPSSRVLAKLDATSAYLQCKLSEFSKRYFNFICPLKKFRYKVAPMGCINSGSEWNRKTDIALEGVDVQKEVDDLLVDAANYEELAVKVKAVLERCKQHTITLSRKKVEIRESVTVAGFIISKDGCLPDPKKIQALKDFPTPKNETDLKSFFGDDKSDVTIYA